MVLRLFFLCTYKASLALVKFSNLYLDNPLFFLQIGSKE